MSCAHTVITGPLNGQLCCRKVITPKADLAKSEEGWLSEGRLQRSTVARICENETELKPDILLYLMERFDMLIPYKGGSESSGTSVHEYLVPCMMKRIPESKVRKTGQGVKNIPMLYFKFVHRDFISKEKEEEGAFLPHGVFHRVESRCFQVKKKWNKGAIYYDYMEFSTDEGVFYLRMAYDSILLCAIQMDESYETEDQIREILSNQREEIQALIDDVLQTTCPNLTCVHYLGCMSKGHEHRYNTV